MEKFYKEYRISGSVRDLAMMEGLLSYISTLCSIGATRNIKLWVDGDGAASVRVEPIDGPELAHHPKEQEAIDNGTTLEFNFE